MKSIYFYASLISCVLFLATPQLRASDLLDTRIPAKQKQLNEQHRVGGEGQGDEPGDGEGDQDKRKQKAKEQAEKAKQAKVEAGSFGILKDLFQSTFDYLYAPDSTKSTGIGNSNK